MGKFREAGRFTAAGIVLIVCIAAFVILAPIAGVYINGWISDQTSDRIGETNKNEQVEQNAAFRVQAYDHFFNLCTAIQELEATIAGQKAELESEFTSDARKAQIMANLGVLQAQRDSKINEYNNDAAKDYTTGQFKDADLPPSLSKEAEETTCTV